MSANLITLFLIYSAVFISTAMEPEVECPASHSSEECKEHKDQSPVDINTSAATDSDSNECGIEWDVDYDHQGFKVENVGHSLQVTAVKKGDHAEDLNTKNHVIALFADIFADNDKHSDYCLSQYHFHWGDESHYGSEHTINEHHYPLEVHFVHFACDDESVGDALAKHDECVETGEGCDEDGDSLGVISILFEISSKDNPAFDNILSESVINEIGEIPEEGTHSCTYVDNANMKDLINGADSGGYYSYKGSLTTPPCSDIVRWYILDKKSYVSERQMEQFRKIKLNPDFFSYQHGNFREIQRYIGDEATKCNVADDGNGNGNGNGGDKGGDGSKGGDIDININGDRNIVIINGNDNLNGRTNGGGSDSDSDDDDDDGDDGDDSDDSDDEEKNGNTKQNNGESKDNGSIDSGDEDSLSRHNTVSNPSMSDNIVYSGNSAESNNDGEGEGVVISLSETTLAHVWGIAFGVILLNVILFYCYTRHQNGSKTSSKRMDDNYIKSEMEEPSI